MRTILLKSRWLRLHTEALLLQGMSVINVDSRIQVPTYESVLEVEGASKSSVYLNQIEPGKVIFASKD